MHALAPSERPGKERSDGRLERAMLLPDNSARIAYFSLLTHKTLDCDRSTTNVVSDTRS